MKDVTVAVVSWNTRELLRRCLAALGAEARADVWVVDNASSDGSAELVRSEYPATHLLALRHNAGFGAAVNLVAARTATPWLVAANADAAPAPGALDRLVAAARADPRAGAVAPRLVLPDGSTQHSVLPFPTVAFTAAFATGLAALAGDRLCLHGRWDPSRPRRVPWAIGAFLLLRREAFDAAGCFDERQWLYAEDLDLGWRLRRAGWATRYEPSAVVHHAESAATAARWSEARVDRWQQATYAHLLRRRGVVVLRTVAALNVLGAVVRGERGWAIRHARAGLLASSRALLASEQE